MSGASRNPFFVNSLFQVQNGICPVCGNKLEISKSLAVPKDYGCCCTAAKSEEDLIQVRDLGYNLTDYKVPDCSECRTSGGDAFERCRSRYVLVHPACEIVLRRG